MPELFPRMALLQIRTEVRRLWAFIKTPETLTEETLKTKLGILHDVIAESEGELVVLHKKSVLDLREKGPAASAETLEQVADALAYSDTRENQIAGSKGTQQAPPAAPVDLPVQTV